MPVSEPKRVANQTNSLKSTGPKDTEKVRLNAVKHGLRSAQLVLPGEDPSEFDALLASWLDDWKPATAARRALVEECVGHLWRLRRCLKAEREYLLRRALVAADARKAASFAEVEPHVKRLRAAPALAVAALKAHREGVAWLIAQWKDLLPFASLDGWTKPAGHHVRLMNLLGVSKRVNPATLGDGPVASLRLIFHTNPKLVDKGDVWALGRPEEYEAGKLADVLANFIREQIAGLESELEGPFAGEEVDAGALACAGLLEETPEGRRLHRYEEMHGRAFRSSLNALMKLVQTGVDLVPDDPAPTSSGTDPGERGASAPCLPESVTTGHGADAPRSPRTETPQAAAPNKATVDPSRTLERDREGRLWPVEGVECPDRIDKR